MNEDPELMHEILPADVVAAKLEQEYGPGIPFADMLADARRRGDSMMDALNKGAFLIRERLIPPMSIGAYQCLTCYGPSDGVGQCRKCLVAPPAYTGNLSAEVREAITQGAMRYFGERMTQEYPETGRDLLASERVALMENARLHFGLPREELPAPGEQS